LSTGFADTGLFFVILKVDDASPTDTTSSADTPKFSIPNFQAKYESGGWGGIALFVIVAGGLGYYVKRRWIGEKVPKEDEEKSVS